MTPHPACPVCQSEIPEQRVRYRAKYCSTGCRQEVQRQEYRALNHRLALPTATVGALRELLVAADLMARGFEVFRALSPAASCDLAILRQGCLLRVEVTSGTISVQGTITWPKKPHPHDVLAVVVGQEIRYLGLPVAER